MLVLITGISGLNCTCSYFFCQVMARLRPIWLASLKSSEDTSPKSSKGSIGCLIGGTM